jgi:hypothetical protein
MTITGDKAEYERYLAEKMKEGTISAKEKQWLKYEAAMAEKRAREVDTKDSAA